MYVSIRDDTLLATGFPSIAEGLRYYGLRAVELAVDRDHQVRAILPDSGPFVRIDGLEGIQKLEEQCAETGLRISAFLLPNNFNSPELTKELDWIVRTVEVASHLGVPAVRIDAIMHGERDLPLEERERIFASGVRHVLNATQGMDVDLGIENHGYQGNDPAFLEGLLELVGDDRLGLTMDTGNLYWAGHPLSEVYRILERLAPRTKHTHVKNIKYPEEMRETRRELGYEYGTYVCPIPEGDIDCSKVVGFLQAAGYNRDLCIEDESLGKYDEAGRRANIRSAAEYLQSLVGS